MIDLNETEELVVETGTQSDALGNAATIVCEELNLGMVIVIARVGSAMCMRASCTNEADGAASKVLCEAIIKVLKTEEVSTAANRAFKAAMDEAKDPLPGNGEIH